MVQIQNHRLMNSGLRITDGQRLDLHDRVLRQIVHPKHPYRPGRNLCKSELLSQSRGHGGPCCRGVQDEIERVAVVDRNRYEDVSPRARAKGNGDLGLRLSERRNDAYRKDKRGDRDDRQIASAV
ncbi:MAG: hypothetical protein AMS22_09395 [Thiotrichales bacterium SG8_50]|nr:MAG: hypothetical protein AMS22_09395 [Thiotrichales bacterium SG8_50]